MHCTFKKLSGADLSMVLAMNRSFREHFIDGVSAERFLNNEKNWIFAAVRDGTIIGFAYGYELNRLDRNENMLYIYEVGVMDRYQRQGIGFAMMTELLRTCGQRNICKCFLTTYQNNAAANALYRKLGGQVPEPSQGKDTVYYFPIPIK